MSNKIYRDIPRLIRNMKIIEQYNNFHQLGAEEDIKFLREKIDNLLIIKNTTELIKDFMWCAKMTNMYIDEIDPEFKSQILKEERKKELDEFN
jgi:hypothetical protein